MSQVTTFASIQPISHGDLLTRIRIQFAQAILAFQLFTSLGIIAAVFADYDIAQAGSTINPLIFPIVSIIWALVALGLLLRRQRMQTIINLATVWLSVIIFGISGQDPVAVFAVMTLALISSALLSTTPVYLLTLALIAVRLVIHLVESIATSAGPISSETFESAAFSIAITTTLLGLVPFLISLLIRTFIAALQTTVQEAQRSAQLVETSASIGQLMARVLDVDSLTVQAANAIRDRFGFYHVQIFMIDEGREYAVLYASTNEADKPLPDQRPRLTLNTRHLVGQVVKAGEAIIARETNVRLGIQRRAQPGQGAITTPRAELGVPIIDADTVIGVLKAQSLRTDAFSETEVNAMQVMATQIATATRNARLFQQQEDNLRENKRLFLAAEGNLREIQRLNRQLTRQAWDDYLTYDRRIEGVTLADNAMRPGAQWTPTMIEASQRRRVIIRNDEKLQIIAVPIELRNEVIGAIEMEIEEGSYGDDMIDLMQALAGRLAMSIDNARLFEETQEATAQEQRISELVAEFQEAGSVDELLQSTLRTLAETLGAEHGSIRLGRVVSPLSESEPPTDSAEALPPPDASPVLTPDSTPGRTS